MFLKVFGQDATSSFILHSLYWDSELRFQRFIDFRTKKNLCLEKKEEVEKERKMKEEEEDNFEIRIFQPNIFYSNVDN